MNRLTRRAHSVLSHRCAALALAAIIGGLLTTSPAAAQEEEAEFVNGRPVWENADAGAVIARSPGRLVQSGNFRFQEAHNAAMNHARNGPEITEVEPEVDFDSALRAELITGLFEGVNSTLAVISAAIGAGLGLDGDGTDGGADAPDLSDLLGVITGSADGEIQTEPQTNTE